MSAPAEPVRIGGGTLGRYRHVCGLFSDRDEEYRVLLPYVKEGLDRGEKTVQITDIALRADHMRRLEAAGIDTAAAQRSGHIEALAWEESYVHDNRFDADGMLARLEDMFRSARARGFPMVRASGHMEWALAYRLDLDDLVEYEARVNYVSARHPDPMVCLYDLSRFGASVIIDVLRTHPMAIVGGMLQENPFFVPPDEFLRQRRGRAA